MKSFIKFSLLATLLFFFWACTQTNEPDPYKDYSDWLRYMVHTTYDNSTGQSVVSYQHEKSNFSTYGISGFSDQSVATLDGILLAHIAPLHPWDYRTKEFDAPELHAKAIFRNNRNTDSRYKVFLDSDLLPLERGALYFEEYSHKTYRQSAEWTIQSPSGTVSEKILLQDSLMPLMLSSDTISISKGETISWSNPVVNGFVVINFLNWGNDITRVSNRYIRTGIMVPDTGAYTFSKRDFLYAGIEPGDIVSIKLIRGKFYTKEFPEISKKFGFLSTTSAAIQVWVKE